MADEKHDAERPLKSEALKRDEWRGETILPADDVTGHTPPASEAGADDESPRPSGGVGGTILPPD